MGAGGGSGDVYLRHELEFPTEIDVKDLVKCCHKHMILSSEQQKAALEWRLLKDSENNGGKVSISKYGFFVDYDMSLDDVAFLLVAHFLNYDRIMAGEIRANLTGNPRRTVIVSSSLSWATCETTITNSSHSASPTHGILPTLSSVI
jgi:hypothetical protein